MYFPPKPPQATIIIAQKEIKIESCTHLNKKNVKDDLVLYKIINEKGKREYFGTCSLCYLTKISRKDTVGIQNNKNED